MADGSRLQSSSHRWAFRVKVQRRLMSFWFPSVGSIVPRLRQIFQISEVLQSASGSLVGLQMFQADEVDFNVVEHVAFLVIQTSISAVARE